MIYYIYEFRDALFSEDGFFFKLVNVLRYVTARAGGACLTSFILSIFLGDRVIRRLISLKLGQPVRTAEEVHKLAELHGGKVGTPTMGGVLILATFVLSAVVWARWDSPFIWVVLAVALALGGLGFIDDYQKVSKGNSAGISARQKLVAQILVAVAAGAVLLLNPSTSEYAGRLFLPFLKGAEGGPGLLDLGWWCLPFYVAVIVGASNAVNLTDGLDGLASGCTITTALAYGLLGYIAGNTIYAEFLYVPYHDLAGELAVVCLALVGSVLGFLWFNCHPARVFMGDTGSLAIGGALGAIAICCRQEIILAIVGGVFVMEAVSVILQVGSFKLTGKRIFKMAPIHHHFELKGWSESQVIVRLWILSLIFALVGLATLKLR